MCGIIQLFRLFQKLHLYLQRTQFHNNSCRNLFVRYTGVFLDDDSIFNVLLTYCLIAYFLPYYLFYFYDVLWTNQGIAVLNKLKLYILSFIFLIIIDYTIKRIVVNKVYFHFSNLNARISVVYNYE